MNYPPIIDDSFLISYEDFETLAAEQGIDVYIVQQEQIFAGNSEIGSPPQWDNKKRKITAIFSGEKERRIAISAGNIKQGSLMVQICGRDISLDEISDKTRLSYDEYLYELQLIRIARHRGKVIFYEFEVSRTEHPDDKQKIKYV